jgi:hypothetical protein
MMKPQSLWKRGLLAVSLAAALSLSAGPANAGGEIDADAEKILRAMSKHLGALKAFSVSMDISNEVITTEGQKLQFNASSVLLVERPSHFYAARQGRFVDAAMTYDGSKVTLLGKELNAYVQKDLTGTIDDAVRALEQRTGLALPAADLLLSDSYSALTSGVVSSGHYGKAFVGGVETHHLGFRTPDVDWQIWVKAGDEPLPMKYVITTKWVTGAPQYSIQMRNWNTDPVIPPAAFSFVPPQGSIGLEVLPVDETGEIVSNQEGK